MVIGVSTGSGLLLIIIVIIVIIVVACHRRRNKPRRRTEERAANNFFVRANNIAGPIVLDNDIADGPIELDDDDKYYSLPDAEADNNSNSYCRPLPAVPGENEDNNTLSVPSPTNDHSPYIPRGLKHASRSPSCTISRPAMI